MVTSVIELSSTGQVLNSKAMHLYPSGLLFGVSASSMRGIHISKYLPMLKSRSMSPLFAENGLGGYVPTAVTAAANRAGPDRPHKRSNLKGAGSAAKSASEIVGPIQYVRIKHQSDDDDIQLTIQVRAYHICYAMALFPCTWSGLDFRSMSQVISWTETL